MDDLRSQLTGMIAGYLASTGRSARTLSFPAAGSEYFVRRLKLGTTIRLGTV